MLTHKSVPGSLSKQGYQLITGKNGVIIRSHSEEGLFYGTQTLLQIIRTAGNEKAVAGVAITDWPDIAHRAIHYDTKHHQDKADYVKSFIKDLSQV